MKDFRNVLKDVKFGIKSHDKGINLDIFDKLEDGLGEILSDPEDLD